jgi:addiction module HigA family antidote
MSTTTITNQCFPDVVPMPGETLLKTIEAVRMRQSDLAERIEQTLPSINDIIEGRGAITPETVLRLEMALGVPAMFWLNFERAYRRCASDAPLTSRAKGIV